MENVANGQMGQPFGQKHTEKKQEKKAAFIHSLCRPRLNAPNNSPNQQQSKTRIHMSKKHIIKFNAQHSNKCSLY
jgi:hypothetical protein